MKLTKTGGTAGANYKAPAAPRKPKADTGSVSSGEKSNGFALPEEPSQPVTDPGQCTILIYGEKKIGKTSLASRFPDAVFIMFEPGGKGLRIYRIPEDDAGCIASWREFKGYLKTLLASKRFRTVIIDTVDFAYDRCLEHVCQQKGVEHPNEGNFGDVWKAIEAEFSKTFNSIIASGRGLIFISHAEDREFQTRAGSKYNKLVPSMQKAPRKFTAGIADIIGYYGYYGEDRFLTLHGSEDLEAGHRLRDRFRTMKGERIHSIPMGKDEDEAYANFLTAWNNKQRDTGEPEDYTGLSEMPVKRQRGR